MTDPPQPNVVAVVVAYMRTDTLNEVLTSLRAQTRPPEAIVIVDNGALPAVKELLRQKEREVDDIHVVERRPNGGSAGGFGTGLAAARQRPGVTHMAVFDDDAIPANDCLERLMEVVDTLPSAGAAGAVSKARDGGFAWPMYVLGRRDPLRTYDELIAFAGGRSGVPVHELAWHAVVFPVTTFDTVGGPWEGLFMWYEDVEYGLRMRRAKLLPYVVPDAQVEHPPPARVVKGKLLGVHLDVAVVSPSKVYLMTRNALVVRRKYMGPKFWVVDLPLTLIRGVIAARTLPGSTFRISRGAVVGALVDALRGRLGPPPSHLDTIS